MIASTMILTGSILILALAGYWMRRALKAERRAATAEARVVALQSEAIITVEHYEREADEARKLANRRVVDWMARARSRGEVAHAAGKDAAEYRIRLSRIIALETPNMAHVGKKAVAIARGDA